MAISVETFFLDPDAQGTLQAQIQQMIAQGILSGRFRKGEKLPSSRRLADHLGVSRITVTLAYTELQANDYLSARDRSGYYVSDNAPGAAGVFRPPPPAGQDRLVPCAWAAVHRGRDTRQTAGLVALSLSVHLRAGRSDAIRPWQLAAMRVAGIGAKRLPGDDDGLLRSGRSAIDRIRCAPHIAAAGHSGRSLRDPDYNGRTKCPVAYRAGSPDPKAHGGDRRSLLPRLARYPDPIAMPPDPDHRGPRRPAAR